MVNQDTFPVFSYPGGSSYFDTNEYIRDQTVKESRAENRAIEDYIIGFMMTTGLTIDELKEKYILEKFDTETDFGGESDTNDYTYSWTTHYRLRLKTPEEKTDDNRS